MDAAVPGMALGVAIGRFGDLIVGDHLGKRTDFFLGYVCRGTDTASPCMAPVGQAVHQPALYDIISATLLLVVLLWLRRTPRYAGFLTLVFGAWYGIGRIIEDFFRIDVTHGTGLTGSQWAALVTVLVCLYSLVVLRHPPGIAASSDALAEPRADHADHDPTTSVGDRPGDRDPAPPSPRGDDDA
jgi:prolipoprotein diacylglyceryltransferase